MIYFYFKRNIYSNIKFWYCINYSISFLARTFVATRNMLQVSIILTKVSTGAFINNYSRLKYIDFGLRLNNTLTNMYLQI